jgi:hypothetical protein
LMAIEPSRPVFDAINVNDPGGALANDFSA